MTRIGARPLAAATALVFLLGLLGLATVDEEAGSTRITAAAAATTAQRTARMAMVVSFGIGEKQQTTLTGEGEVDMEAGRVRMVLRPASGDPIEVVSDGTTAWVKTGGKWTVVDPETAGTGLGAAGLGGSSDPLVFLRLLQDKGAAGDIREKGVEDVRGTPTTRYVAELDIGTLVDLIGSKQAKAMRQLVEGAEGEVDVWVAADDTVRRTVVRMRIQGFVTTATMELFDFGVPVDIQPPV